MFRKIKKVIAFALALTMLMGMSTVAFAAEKGEGVPEYTQTNEEGMSVSSEGKSDQISPMLWPGSGPAPQVTSISLYRYGWLTNGNFGVTLKVYGYGTDTTTFNGRTVSWIDQEPFIISGTGADGFYYTYDCGPVTQVGSYTFTSTFRSSNFPYGERTFTDVFTFSNN